MTPLDEAHKAMQNAGENDAAARLRYYERLADTELFVLLSEEASGEAISPELFKVEQGQFALAFDLEERLATFSGQVVPYAAMSGRILAQMLDGQGIGLGVNLEVAQSSFLIPPDGVTWLNRTLAQSPDRIEARIAGLHALKDLPKTLASALEAKLANAGGLVPAVFLVGVDFDGGRKGVMLGFVGVADPAQDALAKAVGEALTFAGIEAGALDVGFFTPDDAMAAHLAAHGLRLDLPQPVQTEAPVRLAPGRDPDKPPILK